MMPGLQLAVPLDAEQRPEDRNAAEVVVGPVDGVEEPAHRRAARVDPEFLADDPMAGEGIGNPVAEESLDRGVGFGDERPVGLPRRHGVAPKVPQGDGIGLVAPAEGGLDPAPQLRVGAAPKGRAPVRAEGRIGSGGQDRILVPSGSQSGSRATSNPTHDPEDVDLATRPDRGLVRREVGVGDGALDGEAVATRRDAADDLAVDPDGLVAEGDRPGVVEDEAAKALPGAGRLRRDERFAAEEVRALVEPRREAEPGLVWRLLRGDVARPDAIALLDPQGIDRSIPRGHHDRAARRPPRARSRAPDRTRPAGRAPSPARRRR